jgi:hypothetical protein
MICIEIKFQFFLLVIKIYLRDPKDKFQNYYKYAN